MSESTPDETPKPRRGAPPKGWKPRFLKAFRDTGNIRISCTIAGCARKTAYRHRARDPAFRDAWDAAEQDAADLLELEAHNRALHGVVKPVFHEGREVGFVTEYSDLLLIALLRAHRPEKYRAGFNIDALLAAIEARGLALPGAGGEAFDN
jgi:hypothetical protein